MHRHIKSRPLLQIVEKLRRKRQVKQPKRSQFVPNVLLKQFAKPNEMSFQNGSQSGRLMHSEVDSHAKSRRISTSPLAEINILMSGGDMPEISQEN